MTPVRDAAARRDDEAVTPTAIHERPRLTVVESPKSGLPPRTTERLGRAVRTVATFFAVGPTPT
jgi:hypothetical protein